MKKLLATLLLIFTLSACASYNIPGRVKNITLGMTKEQVIATMGDNYKVDGAVDHPDGVIEIISYYGIEDAMSIPKDVVYFFQIQNNKLVEWHKEYISVQTN